MATKLYHMASKVNEQGGVSALCFAQKRSIDLRRASWVLRPESVTCPRCKRLLAERPTLDTPLTRCAKLYLIR
jgi:hypothetical protein